MDCFSQLFDARDKGIGDKKVVENNGNAQDAQAEQPSPDPEGESGNKSGFTTDKNLAPSRNGAAVPSLSGQPSPNLDGESVKNSGFTTDKNLAPTQNGVAALSLSGQSGHSGGEKLPEREARRTSQNLRHEYRNGYVVQPDPKNLECWRVGKSVDGAIRWLDQCGTREWAVEEVKRLLERTPTPPPVIPNDEDHTADVLNTLICDIDDGKFDLSNPDDVEIVKDQIATDIPEVADMAKSLLLDLDGGHLTLDDVRDVGGAYANGRESGGDEMTP